MATSAYYAWTASQTQGPSLAEVAEQRLMVEIGTIHADSDGVYGRRGSGCGLLEGRAVDAEGDLDVAAGGVGVRAAPVRAGHQLGDLGG